ncbi:MAG TPA: cupin domain-containing protein [Gaiellaceae bacterium]|jgi:quercetin dioxygenase-like cupin family protein|nr:cupin domain-containing protein [Gaiellaceae bacterium]
MTGGRKRFAIAAGLVSGAVATVVVAQALATPGSGAVSSYVARGPVSQSVVIGVPETKTATKTVRVRVGRKTVTRRVSFTYNTVSSLMTCGATACDTAYQQLTIAPGGHTGWHTHPGPTFVAVAQGEGTLYHAMSGCPATKYAAGSGFMQPPTEVHNMRNEGSAPLVLWAFYTLPPGTSNAAIRIDQPKPAECPNIP